MADISKIKLPNGDEYDLKVRGFKNIAPILSKTYEGVIGTANTWAGATFFYGSIKPTSWNALWEISFKIRTYIPNKNQYDQIADVRVSGSQGVLKSYSSYNTVGTYYPAYYHVLYRLKQAGFNNDYGHALGVRFYSAYSPSTVGYERTIEIDVYEVRNCTFSFYDNCLKYAEIPGTGSTNYDTYSEMNYLSNGLQETGDANDANYQNRVYYSNPGLKAYAAGGRYTLTFTKDDNYVLPITATDNKYSGEAKTYTTESFDPFREIYYRNVNGAIAANAQIGNATLYRQIIVDARYSFTGVLNGSSSVMAANKPVYIVCIPQSDGFVKLAENPLAFELPITEDGLFYILLGYAYSTYQFELLLNHPIYWYKDGKIRQYFGDPYIINGHTVNADVPSDAVFTDTTYTDATTSVSGLMSSSDKIKLNNIATGAEVNQNAFSSIYIYQPAIDKFVNFYTASTSTDALNFFAGDNVSINGYMVQDPLTWITTSAVEISAIDTKNTAGSTDTSSKIFLIGATSQAANPQTYSQDTAYVGTDGKLYSNNKVVLTGGSNAASTVTITPSTTDVYSMTSAGSVTAGTANVPTVIDTSKFSGGSFTRGTFSQGTLPTLTFAMDTTDTKKLKITFGQGTLPTHANDSFTAAAIQSGFYTAGTANTPTAVTLPGRSSTAIKAWTGYTAATAAAQTFTGSSS